MAIVGELGADGTIEVVGLGSHPSRGLKKGVVVNIESTVQSIQRAVEEAELMAGCEIHSVYAGIAGSHVRSLNSHGIVAIRDREVTPGDVERVIDAAKAVAIPADQKILHVLPQEFIIDGQEGIREPIGMSGVRLEAKVHIVTGADSAAQNIVKCVQRCGLEVEDIVLEQLASSYAVLTDDEKELGVCLVDIGGGTTDIAVFSGGAIRHTAVIPIAGDQVTNDIARVHAHADAVRRGHQDHATPARCRSSPTRTRPSRCRASATARRAAWRARRSPRWSSRATRSCSAWSATSCAAAASRSRSPPASCSPAAARRWKARSSWPRRSSTCRCGWACRSGVSGLVDVVRNPIHSTGVGLLLYARENTAPAGRGRAVRATCGAWWTG